MGVWLSDRGKDSGCLGRSGFVGLTRRITGGGSQWWNENWALGEWRWLVTEREEDNAMVVFVSCGGGGSKDEMVMVVVPGLLCFVVFLQLLLLLFFFFWLNLWMMVFCL